MPKKIDLPKRVAKQQSEFREKVGRLLGVADTIDAALMAGGAYGAGTALDNPALGLAAAGGAVLAKTGSKAEVILDGVRFLKTLKPEEQKAWYEAGREKLRTKYADNPILLQDAYDKLDTIIIAYKNHGAKQPFIPAGKGSWEKLNMSVEQAKELHKRRQATRYYAGAEWRDALANGAKPPKQEWQEAAKLTDLARNLLTGNTTKPSAKGGVVDAVTDTTPKSLIPKKKPNPKTKESFVGAKDDLVAKDAASTLIKPRTYYQPNRPKGGEAWVKSQVRQKDRALAMEKAEDVRALANAAKLRESAKNNPVEYAAKKKLFVDLLKADRGIVEKVKGGKKK